MTTATAPTLKDANPASAAVILSTMLESRKPALPAKPAETALAVVPPAPREPGIYFGLPERDYHADPSLGSTDHKRLLRSTMDYWSDSWMNPRRDPENHDTPAKKQGRALHKLVLEGRAAFHKAYIAEPQPADWPKALRTADDLKAVLREAGEKLAGDKAELIKRVKGLIAAGTLPQDTIVWDEVLANFQAVADRDRLEVLKPDVLAQVETAGHMIAMNPHLANAFKGGVSEVSVFWRGIGGIPLKARYDYLKPFAIPDLKKCENKGEHPFPVACRLALRSYRYDMQVQHYLEGGYPAFLDHARAGRIFGDCPLPVGFAQHMAAAADMTFTLVFHQTSGAPVSYGMEIEAGSPVLARARSEVAFAQQQWLSCMERFGTSEWVSEEPIHRLTTEDMPYEWRIAAEMAEAA
jgi:hypothetical protein